MHHLPVGPLGPLLLARSCPPRGRKTQRPVVADQAVAPAEHHDPVVVAVSREMVRLYKEQFGRGPTSAPPYGAGSDTLIAPLEDPLTAAERNMVRLGEHERLREARMFFQYASVVDFCDP